MSGRYNLPKTTWESRGFTVPEGLTLAQRVGDSNCAWGGEELVRYFAHDPDTVGEWEFTFYLPGESVSTEAAISRVQQGGWVAPKAEHLIACLTGCPDLPASPVVALGAECGINGDRHILGVSSLLSERGFSFFQRTGLWPAGTAFLWVRGV